MGLQVVIDSLDGLDDAIKGLYKQSGDNYVLDVSGVDSHPKVAGLSKTMRTERDARKQFEKELKDLQSKTSGLDLDGLKDIDLSNYKKALTELETFKKNEQKRQTKKLKDKEEWEKLENQLRDELGQQINDIKTQHQAEVDTFKNKIQEVKEKSDQTVTSMFSSLEKQLKDKEVIEAIAKAKGNITILQPHVEKHVKIIQDDDGAYAARIMDDKSNVRINDEGQPLSISEFVNQLREKPEFQGEGIFEKEKKSGGSGSGGNNGNETGEKNPFTKEYFNLTEQGKLHKENPAEYKRLKALAGKG